VSALSCFHAVAARQRDRRLEVRQTEDPLLIRTRGEILLREGLHGEAILVVDRALNRGLSLHGQARMRNLDGLVRFEAGDMPGAFDALSAELAIYEELGFEANIASAHGNLAELAMHLEQYVVAATHQEACLDLALEIGQPVMIAFSAIVAARLAARDGDWVLAVRLQASAERELAAASHTLYPADQAELDALLRTSATEHLGDEAVATQLRLGADLGPVATASLAAGVLAAVRSCPPDADSTNSSPDPNN
jgi:hypothetical protein